MTSVGESVFPEICDECREMFRWKGPSKRRVKVCGCTPPPPAKPAFGGVGFKTIEATRKKGDRGEKRAVRMLTGSGLLAQQTAGSGATASRNSEKGFDTDIVARLGDMRLKIEVKSLERVPGLKSLLTLKAGSEILCVEGPDGVFWLMDDGVARQILALAAEGLETR